MQRNIVMLLGHDMTRPIVDPRVLKEAASLTQLGHEVKILSFSDYDSNSEFMHPGFEVIRIAKRWNGKKHLKTGALKGVSLFALDYFLSLPKRVLAVVRLKPTDIHCHDIDTLPTGLLARLLLPKARLIYDSHELSYGLAVPPLFSKIIILAETLMFPFVNVLITANRSRLDAMRAVYKGLLTEKQCEVVENFPNPSVFQVQVRARTEALTFLYQGPLESGRGIAEILTAFAAVTKTAPDKQWRLLIVGGRQDQIQELEKRFPQLPVTYTGFLSTQKLFTHMTQADIGILALKNNCLNNYYAAPNKLYEYMQAGCAVLGPSFTGLREFIRDQNIGWVTSFDTHDLLCQSIFEILHTSPFTIAATRQEALKLSSKYEWQENEPVLKAIYGSI